MNRGAQPSFNRPAAPSGGNFSHAQSAPAPHYNAPSGGGFHGGGGNQAAAPTVAVADAAKPYHPSRAGITPSPFPLFCDECG